MKKEIDDRESIGSIQSTIDEIKENINTIEMHVIPEFPIVLIVLASITSIAILTRFKII
ncbi:MAG: hypothetical protein QXK74_01925 [Candidatus Nitrosocaldaceae archaeon]